jgi:hypothetical protein
MNGKKKLTAAERMALSMLAAAAATAQNHTESRALSRVLTVLNLCAEGKFGEAAEILATYHAEEK